MSIRNQIMIAAAVLLATACKKDPGGSNPPPPPPAFHLAGIKLNGQTAEAVNHNIATSPLIRFSFNGPVDRATVSAAFSLIQGGAAVPFTTMFENQDSAVVLQPSSALSFISKYSVSVSSSLKSVAGRTLSAAAGIAFITKIDSSRKFPVISEDALLNLVQQQTFKYFWDFGHPVSGMARERNSSGDVVTTGGTGFGIMTIPVAVNRTFITRAEGLTRVQKIVSFLKNSVPSFHGAFSHWVNGTSGAVVPFSANDDGADLVETSFLMMGLLTARQYFDGADAAETNLRNDINSLWQAVEWDWFRQNNKKVMYWHWSPGSGWAMNVPIQGWNECLITYVLAASSPTHPISKPVYDSGFARNGSMVNNNNYYGYQLPLGPQLGGPLFFEHYSFLGIRPAGLTDAYASYEMQTTNHTKINYEYCRANPRNYFGYSDSVWGLTASDIESGYSASSPTNDLGVIAPTAALSSMPYTPTESMKALKFFYYVLGDRLWGEYGFKDAFNLHNAWFTDSYLAIDQGPIIVMIENYRTGLLWDLFTSCPEVKSGMQLLGFTAPYL